MSVVVEPADAHFLFKQAFPFFPVLSSSHGKREKMAHKEAYKPFERGTPAGDAIFRLYHRKNMDSTLDPDLLAHLQKLRREREKAELLAVKPPLVPKSRAHVTVPKVGSRRAQSCSDPHARLNAYGHKKKEATIRKEVSEQPPVEPPQLTKPAITEEDKMHFQQYMEYDGEIPQPRVAAQPQAPPSEYEVYESRFDELTREVAERKAFISDMKNPVCSDGGKPCFIGGATPAERQATERRILSEIADRIAEMKKIDHFLKTRPPSV